MPNPDEPHLPISLDGPHAPSSPAGNASDQLRTPDADTRPAEATAKPSVPAPSIYSYTPRIVILLPERQALDIPWSTYSKSIHQSASSSPLPPRPPFTEATIVSLASRRWNSPHKSSRGGLDWEVGVRDLSSDTKWRIWNRDTDDGGEIPQATVKDYPFMRGGIVRGRITNPELRNDATHALPSAVEGAEAVSNHSSPLRWTGNIVESLDERLTPRAIEKSRNTLLRDDSLDLERLLDERVDGIEVDRTVKYLLENNGYTAIDPHLLALRLKWWPEAYPPCTLSLGPGPFEPVSGEYTFVIGYGPNETRRTWQNRTVTNHPIFAKPREIRYAVVLVPYRTLVPRERENASVEWKLVVIDSDAWHFWSYWVQLLDGERYDILWDQDGRSSNPAQPSVPNDEVQYERGGILLCWCTKKDGAKLFRLLMDSNKETISRAGVSMGFEWAWKTIQTLVKKGTGLLAPDKVSPLPAQWVDAVFQYLRVAMEEEFHVRASTGRETVRGRVKDLIPHTCDLVDEQYLNLKRQWKAQKTIHTMQQSRAMSA